MTTHTNNSKATMRSVVWEGKPYHVAIHDIPKPTIKNEEDAIVRITSAAICGSDLHTYRGFLGSANPPWNMGHEALGVVESIGEAVQSVKVGDYVVVPAIPNDGKLTLLPSGPLAEIFGFGPDVGTSDGCQAEYVRCPFADDSLIPIPKPKNASQEHDYLFLSDIWPTGWTGLDFSGFQAGDSVAVWGAGPVGLLCAYSAFLRGATKVYVVDHLQNRLDKGKAIGAIPINFTHTNAAEQILKLEPNGVNRCIDCVGEECLNSNLKPQQNAVINDMVRAVRTGGGLGIIGVYSAQSPAPGRPLAAEIKPTLEFPMTEFWSKNLSMGSGTVDPPPQLTESLLQLIQSGRVRPSFVVSSILELDEAPRGYERFEKGLETKVVFKFPRHYEDAGSGGEPEEL
ncbi:alcohol dehydrogenase [Lophiostoma macrostomum CBS 122681]|uniref:Alcohol dehydrogenase n=1 Tax=Lophiostoma macrostomum CBS 122681 TaxID=1314788 RepID=A0A6A6T809_9PLEO|nr:alcohol dehydrogenase [Lophiostoma macrostomum CBS 122681]